MLTPFETLNLNAPDEAAFDSDTLSVPVQGLITDFEAPEYISGSLAQRYDLDEDQQEAVARFIMEAVMRKFPEAGAVSRMAELTGTEPSVALEMLQSIEENLLNPNDLTLSGILNGISEPVVTTDDQGREGLRYLSLNDLMTDLEPLEPSARMKFLDDAKKFNRIFVLQALSQLKLGAGSGGQALSFRQLVSREAPQFSVRDWVDLIRTDADAIMEPDVLALLTRTPVGAALSGKGTLEARQYLTRISSLPDASLAILFGSTAQTAMNTLASAGTLPVSHSVAAMKLMALLVLGDVSLPQVPALLQRLGIQHDAAITIASTLGTIVKSTPPPATSTRAGTASTPLRPLPPLTTHSQASTQPGSGTASRNIIDLRKTPNA